MFWGGVIVRSDFTRRSTPLRSVSGSWHVQRSRAPASGRCSRQPSCLRSGAKSKGSLPAAPQCSWSPPWWRLLNFGATPEIEETACSRLRGGRRSRSCRVPLRTPRAWPLPTQTSSVHSWARECRLWSRNRETLPFRRFQSTRGRPAVPLPDVMNKAWPARMTSVVCQTALGTIRKSPFLKRRSTVYLV